MSSFKKIFSGKKVLIWGLGIAGGGSGAAEFFSDNGAKVTVTDLKGQKHLESSLKELKGRGIEFVLGKHRPKDFLNADIIIKNPAIPPTSPYLRICKMFKKQVETDITLFFRLFKGKTVGITGTKGKTTTTAMLGEFLEKGGKRFFTAGNIGRSVLGFLGRKKDLAVLELSSFNLEALEQGKRGPHIAVITNVFADHLNRYDNDFKKYFEAKTNIFKYQKKGDWLVLNYDDDVLRNAAKEAPSKVTFFSARENVSGAPKNVSTYISGGAVYHKRKKIVLVKDIKLQGAHNMQNVLAAVTVAKILKIKDRHIADVLRNFGGVAGRCEVIGSVRGVRVINDTCATNPTSAMMGINSAASVNGALYLIAGGVDKSLPYSAFARTVKNKVSFAWLLPGSATDKMIEEFKKISWKKFKQVRDLKEAFSGALAEAKEGDSILMSPAAASFNQFKNEFDRGDRLKEFFKQAVKQSKIQKEG